MAKKTKVNKSLYLDDLPGAPFKFPILFLGSQNQRYREQEIYAELCPLHLAHQCGGVMCNQREFYGLALQVSTECQAWMESLAKHFYDSMTGQTLDSLLEYRAYLQAHKMDCNRAYASLDESVYPIDLDSFPANWIIDPRLVGRSYSSI